ncbi:metal-dependent hydrolase [Virgibacillus sp. NKC19-16]|uniref:metal-dependent hydrolase n=1 Tax=Virgibacillus salidurans TaxID=2831673 RepID=UPI001F31D73C|nr:metal-dependent hydrolase [Virgibacillus sp. NKC19-16]UJL47315.1 metal-dependent hydrolase [Virgibacillus sp. NKC19-16]
MDTGTHIVMGVALGGLATLDPVVQNDPTLFTAVLTGTIIGSHAPDFDTVFKLKNNATYIRHHRGASHSLPAIILWGILIAGIIYMFVPQVNFLHLWLWTFLAVIIHVFVDIFNAYGTQAYRPFTDKWIAHGFINTFDPYIFILHVAGIGAWILGANPGYTWFIIYAVIALYYIKRYMDKREIVKKIKDYIPNIEQIATSPTIKQNYWRVAITTDTKFFVAAVENGHIEIVDEFEKVPLPKSTIMELAKKDKNISAFLSFSPVYRWEINDFDDFTEIRFIDLRYRSDGRYPFVAVVQIDDNMRIMSSYTGWIFSEQKLQSKLYMSDSPV